MNSNENDGTYIIKNVKHSQTGEMADSIYDIFFLATGLTED